jgi:hypothetical protein
VCALKNPSLHVGIGNYRVGNWVAENPFHRTVVAAPGCQRGSHTGNRINNVVVATGTVINRVAATARGSAFEAAQLRDQASVVEQVDLARINGRQQVAIQVALGFCARLAVDALLGKALDRPQAAPTVASYFRDAVTLKQRGELNRYVRRREWRPALPRSVDNRGVVSLCAMASVMLSVPLPPAASINPM